LDSFGWFRLDVYGVASKTFSVIEIEFAIETVERGRL
jgi:hypothetical protein